jgi:hypothetical protein
MDSKHCGEQRSKWVVFSPDIVWWVNTARANGQRRSELGHRVQLRECLKGDFLHLFTFSDLSKAGILITIFT